MLVLGAVFESTRPRDWFVKREEEKKEGESENKDKRFFIKYRE